MKTSFLSEAISRLRSFELIFFPSFCRLCSDLLESPDEKIVCKSCWEDIKPERTPFCLSCGRFFEGESAPHFCAACLQARPPFSWHRSYGRYTGKLKEIILLCKFHNLPILAQGLAKLALRVLEGEEALWWGLECVVPVPLHPKRERQRGYNHAQIIARKLAGHRGIHLLDRQLLKVKNVPPQMSLSLEDRLSSVKGAFAAINKGEVRDKILLLVDDVYTTGATVRECSKVLLKAGAKEVRALTLAQA